MTIQDARMLPILLALTLVPTAPLRAQEAAAAGETTAAPAAAGETTPAVAAAAAGLEPAEQANRYEVRSELTRLLMQHPTELATLLALDPDLLRNQEFLTAHPELAGFVQERPEVAASPHFYLAEFRDRRNSGGALDDMLEVLVVVGSMGAIALALGWFVRTLIEQKRWSRLSRTQAEVHNKILDRFGSSEELLAYIRTPAGARFLESAPIPLHAERPAHNPSLARVMWSVQLGVVVVAAGLGALLVGGRFDEEGAQGLFALGTIGVCVGLGFVAAAAVSIFLSRRLGLWAPPPRAEAAEDASLEGSGLVP